VQRRLNGEAAQRKWDAVAKEACHDPDGAVAAGADGRRAEGAVAHGGDVTPVEARGIAHEHAQLASRGEVAVARSEPPVAWARATLQIRGPQRGEGVQAVGSEAQRRLEIGEDDVAVPRRDGMVVEPGNAGELVAHPASVPRRAALAALGAAPAAVASPTGSPVEVDAAVGAAGAPEARGAAGGVQPLQLEGGAALLHDDDPAHSPLRYAKERAVHIAVLDPPLKWRVIEQSQEEQPLWRLADARGVLND
jgi:hypothetical protein